jgi:hypothetical protein
MSIFIKFVGTQNHQKYELSIAKKNEISDSVCHGSSMTDLDGEGNKELLIFFQYL